MGNGEDPAGVRAFVAGGVGGMAFLVAGQPFDTVKVRMQSQAKGTLYKSSTDCLYKTVSREGIRALFKGMSTPLAACIPSYALWFLGHDHAITLQQKLLGRQEMSLWNHGLAGLTAGAYMVTILGPGERVKCLLQMQMDKKQRKYKGPLDVISKTYREGGFRTLGKGTLVTGLRDVPGSGLFFVLYEYLISKYGESPTSITMAGGVAGVLMWFVGVPPDVIKTLYQTAPHGKYKSSLQIVPELYKSEGLSGFYKGFGPSGIRAFLANGICLLTYDLVIKTWQKLYPLANMNINHSTNEY
ncbi:mitochondrial carnitine/acylcarnitine carrier protein-like [Bolinopsis microptera]|uniref:mitochondrial carnitine/acylcarnitine carrier protein-like n=1 Tax=Bolinopsis microptera TaxID=2820187 RepID=UPI003078B23B